MPQVAISGSRVCIFCSSRKSARLVQSSWVLLHGHQIEPIAKRQRNFHSTSTVPQELSKTREREHVKSKDGIERPRGSEKDGLRFSLNSLIRKQFRRKPGGVLVTESLQDVAKRCLGKMRSLLYDKAFQLETGISVKNAKERFLRFEKMILVVLKEDPKKGPLSRRRETVAEAYHQKQEAGLYTELKYMLAAMLANENFQRQDIVNQIKLADLRYPTEWYPSARKMKRTIHLHIGPTNSGKTYHALKRLETADNGCYAGPLRLLAHEVYTRLNAKNKKCSLITGDEMIVHEDGAASGLWSCTVEMVPKNRELDVAVIDEIQMIADRGRGWAWTQAVLGLQAKELHLCGETRTLPLIQQIAASIGDELVVHNYERLSPLQVAKKSLDGKLENLQKGDCVVSFSRKQLHALKKDIQQKTGKEVAIVYGALPPEIRAQQASLFNDQSNDYDVLVASDAIGMGLNLSVKRIVFETMLKFNGRENIHVDIASIKQIGGRAGRYRTANQDNATAQNVITQSSTEQIIEANQGEIPVKENIGYVTTLYEPDMTRLRKAMTVEPPPIHSACIEVPEDMILRFAAYFTPETPLSYILRRCHEISRVHPRFQLTDPSQKIGVLDAIAQVEGLTNRERLLLACAPVDSTNPVMRPILLAMARCIAARKGGELLNIREINIEVLDLPIPTGAGSEAYIMLVAATHQAVVLYLWLSYRMGNVFSSLPLAFHVKGLLQEKLDTALASARLRRRRFLEIARLEAQAKRNDPNSEIPVAAENSTMASVDDEDDPGLLAEVSADSADFDFDTVVGELLNEVRLGEKAEQEQEQEQTQTKTESEGLDFIPTDTETHDDEVVRGP